MTQTLYDRIEAYMQSQMQDSAHDAEHVFRVLYAALDILETEPEADPDVVIAACLLHDVGRAEQLQNPALCHAQVGAEKAYRFLIENGLEEGFAAHVRDCIRTHRFRSDAPPETREAKILFDADKLDVSGAVGIARTLLYQGETEKPLYTRMEDGAISDGTGDTAPSFFQEYKHKLERLYGGFYTARATALAGERRAAAENFYMALLHEVRDTEEKGRASLNAMLK